MRLWSVNTFLQKAIFEEHTIASKTYNSIYEIHPPFLSLLKNQFRIINTALNILFLLNRLRMQVELFPPSACFLFQFFIYFINIGFCCPFFTFRPKLNRLHWSPFQVFLIYFSLLGVSFSGRFLYVRKSETWFLQECHSTSKKLKRLCCGGRIWRLASW